MDAVGLIREDHRLVESLLDVCRALPREAAEKRARVISQLAQVLCTHSRLVERYFLPELRRAGVEAERVLEFREEHHLLKLALRELVATEPAVEHYSARLRVFDQLVRRHFEREEAELLPGALEALGQARLDELGVAMAAARQQRETAGPGFSVTLFREFPAAEAKRR